LGVADRAEHYQPRSTDGCLRVLCVGRLEKRKGVDLLLEAAVILTREFPHVEFILVGDDTIPSDEGPPYRTLFEQRYGDDPASQRVIFTGQVSESDLYQHYADCDIFCLPARYESFGLVFVEAMMFAKPVVGCASGGMKEVVRHGSNGFLVAPEDVESLVQYLRLLIENAALRRQFGLESRRRYAVEFTDTIMVENTLRAYTEIINHPAHV
jgi:glycosyltransferase involved in cell wall biosynthesis